MKRKGIYFAKLHITYILSLHFFWLVSNYVLLTKVDPTNVGTVAIEKKIDEQLDNFKDHDDGQA